MILAAGAIGAFLIAQAFKATVSFLKQRAALSKIPAQLWSRVAFIGVLLILGVGGLSIAAFWPLNDSGQGMGSWALLFVVAALAFEAGRSVMESFIVDFFGDVQIYTTHDQNADFYQYREKMLEKVTETIAKASSAAAADGTNPYDRVHVLAHSLGSTIAMDALIRLYNLKEQGLYRAADFERIRSFVTFGTSLEKTKYFFDVSSPSISLSYDQWRNDAYGVLFTMDRNALKYPNGPNEGIYWLNFWYEKDPIANAIDSYRSFLLPGDSLRVASAVRGAIAASAAARNDDAIGHKICENQVHPGVINIFRLHFIPHGDYLGDSWFWHGNPEFGALDVVTSRTEIQEPRGKYDAAIRSPQEFHEQRIEWVKPTTSRWYRDRYT
ncbi:MAG: hypothetical protein JO359_14895 [Candidatus Eremiobacteraeota bacterium]|nr:hypothetical protein [Candidatus Eremiobacteraeota bacterium]